MSLESSKASQAPLDEDTQRLLSETTARLVNHAVERRVDDVVRSSEATDRVAKRLWPMALGAAVLILAISVAWLMRGAPH